MFRKIFNFLNKKDVIVGESNKKDKKQKTVYISEDSVSRNINISGYSEQEVVNISNDKQFYVVVNGVRKEVKNNLKVIIDGEYFTTSNKLNIVVDGSVNNVKATSGDITVNGDAEKVKSTSGDILISKNASSVETTSGNVNVKGDLKNAKTVSGNINNRR